MSEMQIWCAGKGKAFPLAAIITPDCDRSSIRYDVRTPTCFRQ